ncbi:MAG: cyclase family protein [Gemmatimonadota bacterium]|nr:cyclase family protein [Gemmatimonadota bacterium]
MRIRQMLIPTLLLLILSGCAPDRSEEAAGAPGDGATSDGPSDPASTYPSMTTAAEYERALEELSNWGRWGPDDELGAANFITPEKRVAAAGLVRDGISVSLAHDIVEVEAVDATSVLDRVVLNVSAGAAMDRLQYTGSYHGVIHSHLDAVACHIMVDGQGYNGVSMEEIQAADACPRGSINALKDGVVTRGVLFDATLLPEVVSPEGWVEPGAAIRAADLLRLEEIQGVRVERGDVILLHTGRWARRDAVGPWPTSEGVAGYHADVAYFMADRGVAFIGHDMWQDAYPQELTEVELLPLHRIGLARMGVGIFDNLDLGRLAETARALGRYDFLFTAAPLRIRGGMGSPLNPIATF